MDPSFKGNGWIIIDMDEECLSQKMDRDMMDFGKMIRETGMEGS